MPLTIHFFINCLTYYDFTHGSLALPTELTQLLILFLSPSNFASEKKYIHSK